MKTNKLPSLISILILTLITSVMWVSFNVYRALTTEAPAEVSPEILKALTPNLDTQTVGQIQSRLFLDDSQIPENIISVALPEATTTPAPVPTEIPNPTATSTPTASPSAEATPTP